MAGGCLLLIMEELAILFFFCIVWRLSNILMTLPRRVRMNLTDPYISEIKFILSLDSGGVPPLIPSSGAAWDLMRWSKSDLNFSNFRISSLQVWSCTSWLKENATKLLMSSMRLLREMDQYVAPMLCSPAYSGTSRESQISMSSMSD